MLDVSKKFNLPEIEEKVLSFWKKNKIFEKSILNRKGAKPFRFFEGPPGANGVPGLHHVLARSFKDIMLRYKTMQGYYVLRRAGWDTHGLPVEVQVEKQLGLKNKSEIEKLGIAEFNSRAKLSVWKYKTDWEKLTERIGFWVDSDNPYITYQNSYIETLWWIFKEIDKSGLLKKSYRVVAWCPRCQTPLSNHELGQPGVYKKVKDPSVYIKFEVKPEGRAKKKREYFLVWTTTPWTLPANIAVAVNSKLTYTKYKVGNEFIWSHISPPKVPGVTASVVEKIAGKKLVGKQYLPIYKNVNSKKLADELYRIVSGDFVSGEEGTGFVHIAPAFGEEDLSLITKKKLLNIPISQIPITIDDRGVVKEGFPGAGKFIKEADKDIMNDLKKRKRVYLDDKQPHEYPFCWRCDNSLIYFARLTWFIEISKLKTELLSANDKINWVPANVKKGRFGEWLRELRDWSISRERYWGTPLPIWEHSEDESVCDKKLVIGSFNELNEYRFNKNKFFIVRHGEAEHNVKNIMPAVPETAKNTSHLTKKGIAQAEKLARVFKTKKIDLIFHSPYERAMKTAEIIGKATGVKVIADKRIGESNSGVFNGGPIEKFHKFFNKIEQRFAKRPTNGESLTDVRRRMLGFISEVNNKYSNKNIVIVSHGSPLWMLDSISRALENNEIVRSTHPNVGEWRELDFPNWPYSKDGLLDCHRPYVDELVLKCDKCGDKMKRVKDVADVWFDSGAMPYAQWHYPFENKELIDKGKQFPADYISEGVEQTRGWFYTLLAVAALLKKGVPYLNVISLGLLLDKNGHKMSKSKGNVVDPWMIGNKYGIDVLRWFFYTNNDPGEQKRFDEKSLLKILRKFHTLFYNSFVFFTTYEKKSLDISSFDPSTLKSTLDRWIVSRLNQTTLEVSRRLDSYHIAHAARSIESLVDDLSHWYIRRSRRRFSNPRTQEDFTQAARTLKFVLIEISKLTAPFCPFLSDAIYASLKKKQKIKAVSVHLDDWSKADKKNVDSKLLMAVSEVRDFASKALALRAEAGIRVRQPLATLTIKSQKLKFKNNDELIDMLKDEINVKEVKFDSKIKSGAELDTKITSELRDEGIFRELLRVVQKVRQEGGYKVVDSVNLFLQLPAEFESIVSSNLKEFKKLVKAKKVEFLGAKDKKSSRVSVKLETKLSGESISVFIQK